MIFFVRVLQRAGQDVEEILRFIAEERGAPEGARRFPQVRAEGRQLQEQEQRLVHTAVLITPRFHGG